MLLRVPREVRSQVTPQPSLFADDGGILIGGVPGMGLKQRSV